MTLQDTRKYTKLTPAVWAEIRGYWQLGEATLETRSTRYGVTTSTLQSHFQKQGCIKGAMAHEIAVGIQKEIFAGNIDDRDVRISKGREARAKDFQNASRIEALLAAQIEESLKGSAEAFKSSAVIRTLALAAQAFERTSAMKFKALGLDHIESLDELPMIIIQDLTEERLAEIHRRNGDDEYEAGQLDD